MNRSLFGLARALLAVGSTASLALPQGQVWTVGAGTGDFESIQAAVEAAGDGDVVLVQAGLAQPYPSFVVDGKALTIVGAALLPSQCGTIRVRNLAPGESVAFRNLHAFGLSATSAVQGHGAWISDCAGAVRFEDCRLAGYASESEPAATASAGVALASCADVVFSNCELSGGGAPAVSAEGLALLSSDAALYGCEVAGGTWLVECTGSAGGDGAVLDAASTLFASGCTLRGGDGSDGPQGCAACGEDGGDALVVLGGSSAALSDVTLTRGLGGEGIDLPGCDGANGAQMVGGPVIDYGEPARTLTTPALLQPGEQGVLTFEGQPGDAAYLLVSRDADLVSIPAWNGALALAKPILPFDWESEVANPPLPFEWGSRFLGVVPPTGSITAPVTGLMPAGEAERVFVQAIAVSAGRARVLGTPSVMTAVAADLTLPDCNGNGIDDAIDLAGGPELDLNEDHVLDECQARIVYVDRGVPVGGDGTSWESAYRNLRDALKDESPAVLRQFWVAANTYTPAPNGSTNPLRAFEPRDLDSLYGGFAGGETSLAERDPVANPTLLSGDLHGDDLPGFVNFDDNCWSVVRFAHGGRTLLDGFVVTAADLGNSSAGAIDASEFNVSGEHRIANCRIVGNLGTGVSVGRCSLDLISCDVEGNKGTGIRVLYDTTTLTLVGCDVRGNDGGCCGGGMYVGFDPIPVEIVGCTFTNNDASHGGGIRTHGTLPLSIRNSIFWDNVASNGTTQDAQISLAVGTPPPELSFSCVEELVSEWGPGNIALDPLFVDLLGPDGVAGTDDDDPRLGLGSPCVDAGRNGYLPADVADLDRDGDHVEELPLDRGGLPRRVDDPDAPDTGSGDAPLVDMGAHERQAP